MYVPCLLMSRRCTALQKIPFWVDREQMQSFMDEYERFSHKEKLLSDRQEKLVAIRDVC